MAEVCCVGGCFGGKTSHIVGGASDDFIFPVCGGWRQRELPVIRDLNIKVREHEVVAVAGSSGSGKSLLAHAVMGLLPQNAACQGTVSFDGEILNQKKKEQLRGAGWYWSPERVVSGSAYESGRTGTKGTKDRESVMRCRQSMGRYGLGEDTEELYPFELSGNDQKGTYFHSRDGASQTGYCR